MFIANMFHTIAKGISIIFDLRWQFFATIADLTLHALVDIHLCTCIPLHGYFSWYDQWTNNKGSWQ